MNWLWGIAAVLVLWAGIAAARRRSEYAHRTARGPEQPGAPRAPGGWGGGGGGGGDGDDDEIDWETLEEAEREVKDLDSTHQPDEGFRGDDWGPGTPRGFPPVP